MTVKELIETCTNMGYGQIKIINSNNKDDNFFGEYAKIRETPIMKFKVKYWGFIPKKQISSIGWDFVLQIIVY